MKYLAYVLLAVSFFAGCFAHSFYSPRNDLFTKIRFDGVDPEIVLRNDRLLKHYFNCLMDRGRCSQDGIRLKHNMIEALKTGCRDCTEKQKEEASKVMKFLMREKPIMWRELEQKYNPTSE